jgi:hypothetical protein
MTGVLWRTNELAEKLLEGDPSITVAQLLDDLHILFGQVMTYHGRDRESTSAMRKLSGGECTLCT